MLSAAEDKTEGVAEFGEKDVEYKYRGGLANAAADGAEPFRCALESCGGYSVSGGTECHGERNDRHYTVAETARKQVALHVEQYCVWHCRKQKHYGNDGNGFRHDKCQSKA